MLLGADGELRRAEAPVGAERVLLAVAVIPTTDTGVRPRLRPTLLTDPAAIEGGAAVVVILGSAPGEGRGRPVLTCH